MRSTRLAYAIFALASTGACSHSSPAGVAGTSGTTGSAGTSGTAGAGGTSGTTGGGGTSGTTGTGGTTGASGRGGTTGGAGTTGTSGTTGTGGADGGAGGLAGGDAGADGPLAPCSVAIDGGAVGCTSALISAHDYDVFCGLKQGTIRCWSSQTQSIFLTQLGDPMNGAPPDLAQIAITNYLSGLDSAFCGVDVHGHGSCWIKGQTTSVGDGLKEVTISAFSRCALHTDGAVTCTSIVAPAAGPRFTHIEISEDTLATLDDAGHPSFGAYTFPAGVYKEIVVNDARRVGALRADGTAVVALATPTLASNPGPFVHVAVDYAGHACALDAAGEIDCWTDPANDGGGVPSLGTPPAGPFVQIVGGETTFCALRATGTTVCFGSVAVDVPAGW